jgi:hypothetical protein
MTDRPRLVSALARVTRRWMLLARLRATIQAAFGAALMIAVALVADVLLAPTGLPLAWLGVVTVAVILALAAAAFWPIRRRPTAKQVARLIEERCPELDDCLTSAVGLMDEANPTAFQHLTLTSAARKADEVDAGRVVDRDVLRRVALKTAAALALLGAILVPAIEPGRRAAQAIVAYVLPSSLSIEVSPGNARVVAGRPLKIVARTRGGWTGAGATLALGSAAGWETRPMAAAGDRFEIDIPEVTADFSYRVSIGNVTSSQYAVTALFAPAVDRIDVEYRYPAFTGLAPRVDEDGGDIYAPAGTSVRLKVFADKPVVDAVLLMADGSRVALGPGAGSALEASLSVRADGSYRVALADADGLKNPGDTEYFIRIMDDRPPDVRIVRPAGDRRVTPLEEVTIEAQADDDHGLDRFELVYSVRGGPETAVPLSRPGGRTSVTSSRALYVEDMRVEPGDFVTYYARARDVGRGKRSVEARSDIFFLEVKPFDEEFTAAESQAGGGGGQGLASLVEAQKEIIIATWKLDRRSTGGRSEQDIRALGRAQGELKAKAQSAMPRLLTPDRRRGRTSGGDEEPLAKAVQAMQQAETALNDLKTAAALPHEMDALNQLLKADAAVRRRQVSRQASAGGGGSGRAGRDLSSLFDRELQRQQQTNYETRSSAQSQESAGESEALARVRELARRQDELARQQQELAERRQTMSAEEARRQLERLTREQSELRRQAEELSRQLGQQQSAGASGSSGGRSADRPDGQRMRDISEEMRGAASDLRRDDATQAATRSGRAAEQLRNLERDLQGQGQGQGRSQRALGEAELEARQLADAQRRVASETERLEGDASADALRRLAGQKDRLADRVSALEQALRDAGRSARGGDRDRADEAASELQREGIAGRMRKGADELRQAAQTAGAGGEPSSRDVKAEQDVARALDRIADRLQGQGSAGDAEARRLSEQLAKARTIGDRLRELERQIEALGNQAKGAGSAEKPAAGTPPQKGQGSSGGREGQTGEGGNSPSQIEQASEKLRAEYEQLMAELEGLLPRGSEQPGLGSTPERHEATPSAPGTQAFKQDFTGWESLRRDVHLALERLEASLSERLTEARLRDRLTTASDDRLPEAYRDLVARYYELLARKKP